MIDPTAHNHKLAALYMILAVALGSVQDAVVKGMSGTYPVYETILIRGLSATPILYFWLSRKNLLGSMQTPLWKLVIVRSLILASAYLAFVMSLAAMPMADAVAIYFTMPLIVAGLARPLLGEHVPLYRWAAIILGFIGVIIILRPGQVNFQPAAILALYSAAGYAVGQMLGRKLSQQVPPLVIANYQNLTYMAVAIILAISVYFTGLLGQGSASMEFLTRSLHLPTAKDFFILIVLGMFAALTMFGFIRAYSLADSNFVATFEYTGIIWAVLFGILFFHDTPDPNTIFGIVIIIGAGSFMLMIDRIRHYID